VGGAIAALLLAASALAGRYLRAAPPPPLIFTMQMPQSSDFTGYVVMSPDGTRVVFASDGRLWVRRFTSLQADPVEGGDGGARLPLQPEDGSRFRNDG
jgi:hypothetical protein